MTNQTNEAVERYKLQIVNNNGDRYIRCEPAPNGAWVMFKDVEAQAARIAELEAALRFYADKNSWVNSVSLGHPQIDGMTSLVELDKGSKALAALGGVKQ